MESNILWEQMKSGDMKAYHQIYEDQVAYLYNYGKKICAKPVLVEDCIHDLFVDIWTKRERLGGTDAIRPYLASSLRRSLVRRIAKDQKLKSVDEYQELAISSVGSIEDWLIENDSKQEKSDQLKHAYKSLTDRQREIIYLRYHQDMDYEDIADVLGVKYQSLRNLLSNAIGGLRAAMLAMAILVFFTCGGCSEESEPVIVDPLLEVYFSSFKEEAENRGVEISVDFETIGAELTIVGDASGQCVTSGEGQRTIRIDQAYWNNINTIKKEFLIFHELGHCYLKLSHDDQRDDSGSCVSMMTSGLGGCRNNYNNQTRQGYLDKLFGL